MSRRLIPALLGAAALAAPATALAAPPTVLTDKPPLTNGTEARLYGKVLSNAGVAGTAFEVGPANGDWDFLYQGPDVLTATTYADTAQLTVGQTYKYRVYATNQDGSTYGPTQTFKAGQATVKAGRSAVSETSVSTRVFGKVTPGGLATTTRVWYGPTQSYGQYVTGTSVSGVTEQEVSGVIPVPSGQTVNYRVQATNAAGTFFGPNVQVIAP